MDQRKCAGFGIIVTVVPGRAVKAALGAANARCRIDRMRGDEAGRLAGAVVLGNGQEHLDAGPALR